MNHFISAGRLALHLGLIGAVCVSGILASFKIVEAQETTRSINGHSVSGRFLQVWSSHGSDQSNVYVNGLPITDRRAEISMTDGKTYDTQWFERARYEAHPDKSAPYDVLLGLLGVTLTEGRGIIDPTTKQARDPSDQAFVKISRPADADGKSKVWFQETGHSVSGKILEYWNKYGGLQQFGFPLSEQFQETSPTDGKTYTVQYFERNRFELHPEKQAPYEVELGLLGVQQYRTQPIPGDQLAVAPPKGVKSTKDTLVFAMTDEPVNLVPGFGGGNATTAIFNEMMFNGSVTHDYKANLWPGDIYYVPTIENGGAYYVGTGGDKHLVIKDKIRFGLRWSDGVPITSNDWIYVHKIALGPADSKLSSVDNPDANTVIYNFMSYNQALAVYNKPDQDKDLMAALKPYIDNKIPVTDTFYTFIADSAPLPEHMLANIPADKIPDSDYARNPVSDGPFKLDKWDSGKQIVLVPNPYYTLTAPPLLKRVIVKFISDKDEMLAQLKTGDLDAAPYFGLSPALDTLAASGLTIDYFSQRIWEHIDINLNRPQFQDKVVRQAMFTGINRQQVIDKVFMGKFTIQNTFLTPKTWASMDNPDFAQVWGEKYPLRKYMYDPATANKMLDDAGWVRGSDGIRAKNGVRLVFDYATTAGGGARTQITQMIAADLKNIGMQANLKYIPTSTLFGDLGPLARRQFDLVEFGYGDSEMPDGRTYDSQNIPSPSNGYVGQNYPGFNNAHYDALSRASELELERTRIGELYAEMQQIIAEEVPMMPLYMTSGAAVYKSNLVNWFDSGEISIHTPAYSIAAMYFK